MEVGTGTHTHYTYSIVVRKMHVMLQTGQVYKLHDAMCYVEAVRELPEDGKSIPGQEIVDETAVAVIAGPHHPGDAKGPYRADQGLIERGLCHRCIGVLGYGTPIGSPDTDHHEKGCHRPAPRHHSP